MPTLGFGLESIAELLKKIKPAPIAEEGALPNIGINARTPDLVPKAADTFNNGNPYLNLKNEAKLREMYPEQDFSGRGYSDPVTQAKYENVYGSGKSVHDIEHPGFIGRLKQGGKAGLLGLMTGKGTGFLGGVVDPAASQEEGFDITQGDRMRQQQGQEMEQRTGMMKIQEMLGRIAHQRQQDQIEFGDFGMRKEKHAHEMGKPQTIPEGSAIPDGKGGYIVPAPRYHPPVAPVERGGGVEEYDPETRTWKARPGAKATSVITADINQQGQDRRNTATIKSHEGIATRSDQTRRDIAALNEGGRAARHEGAGSAGREAKATALAHKWAAARSRALDDRLTEDERKNAFNEMNDHAANLKQNYGDLYDTEGQGGWSYVQRKQGGAPASMAGQKPKGTIALSVLKKYGKAPEEAEREGYQVDRNR